MNRRTFGGHLAKGAVVIAMADGFVLEGCSASTVFTDIANWVPVGEAAVNGILKILSVNGFVITPAIQLIVTAIEGGLNQLLADVKLYQSITPPPVGALASIEAAFGIITQNFQAFLAAINIGTSPLLSTIVAIAQVVLSTISAFIGKLPVPAPAVKANSFHVGSNPVVTVVPKVRSRRAFKKDYNSVLDAAKPAGVAVPQDAYMKLSFFEHMP